MKYVFWSLFTIGKGGYTRILEQISYDLVERGHEVMIISHAYDKSQHDYPFKLVPIDNFGWGFEAVTQLPEAWGADRVIIALDVPDLVKVSNKFIQEGMSQHLWLLEALFPVESDPLRPLWRDALGKFRKRYVMSQFGTNICENSGLPSDYLPIGCTVTSPPPDKEQARQVLNWPQDRTVFLSVTANQERKNLPVAMQAFSRLPKDTHYYMVTDEEAKIGWALMELAEEYDILDRFTIIESGVSRGLLSTMYWAADAYVVTSQAEGGCLPVYEAAQHGLPVISSAWTALEDVIEEDWVMPIGYAHRYRFAWGNVWRWLADVDDVEYWMKAVHEKTVDLEAMKEAALVFAGERSWKLATDVIETGLSNDKLIVKESETKEVQETPQEAL